MKIVLFFLAAITILSAETMSVQVKSAALKEKPSFISKNVATLNYGEKIDVQNTQGDWSEATVGAHKGWVHISALTQKEIALSNTQEVAHGASKSEVVMAGKGFSKETEESYKSTHSLNYADVDYVEKRKPSIDTLPSFASSGKLSID